jgi:hypothetical protein
MLMIGCDFHTRYQQIAMLNTLRRADTLARDYPTYQGSFLGTPAGRVVFYNPYAGYNGQTFVVYGPDYPPLTIPREWKLDFRPSGYQNNRTLSASFYGLRRFRGASEEKETMKLNIPTLVLLFSLLFVPCRTDSEAIKPKDGYVAKERTAVRIAEAVLGDIYGDAQIRFELPLTAKLENEVWTVTGTLPATKGYYKGGVATILISKDSGCILSVSHEK